MEKQWSDDTEILGVVPQLVNVFGVCGGYNFSAGELEVLRAIHHAKGASAEKITVPEMNGQK